MTVLERNRDHMTRTRAQRELLVARTDMCVTCSGQGFYLEPWIVGDDTPAWALGLQRVWCHDCGGRGTR